MGQGLDGGNCPPFKILKILCLLGCRGAGFPATRNCTQKRCGLARRGCGFRNLGLWFVAQGLGHLVSGSYKLRLVL